MWRRESLSIWGYGIFSEVAWVQWRAWYVCRREWGVHMMCSSWASNTWLATSVCIAFSCGGCSGMATTGLVAEHGSFSDWDCLSIYWFLSLFMTFVACHYFCYMHSFIVIHHLGPQWKCLYKTLKIFQCSTSISRRPPKAILEILTGWTRNVQHYIMLEKNIQEQLSPDLRTLPAGHAVFVLNSHTLQQPLLTVFMENSFWEISFCCIPFTSMQGVYLSANPYILHSLKMIAVTCKCCNQHACMWLHAHHWMGVKAPLKSFQGTLAHWCAKKLWGGTSNSLVVKVSSHCKILRGKNINMCPKDIE